MNKRLLLLYFITGCIGCLLATNVLASTTPKKFTLVIDAGHGGRDPGARGATAKEKDINLSVALEFGAMVERNHPNVKVLYTRKTDVFVGLDQRAEIANKAKADLFISIHTNALPNKKIARGAETYTLGMAKANENLEVAKRENAVILQEKDYKERYQGFDPKSSESYIMFEVMQDKYMAQSVNLAKLLQQQFRSTGGRVDKGVHQAGFLVLRKTSMPSVLIELGYISTPDEERFLNSKSGRHKLSLSIYNAFSNYLKEHKKGSTVTGQVATPPTAPHQENVTSPPPAKKESTKPTSAPAASGNKKVAPVFKIQIFTSSTIQKPKSASFKGLTGTEYYQEGGMYKYTYGSSTNYNEMVRKLKQVTPKFKGAFIVAFKEGKKVDVQQAIQEFKQKK